MGSAVIEPHLVILLPDGTKHHFDTAAVPRRGDAVYLTDAGIGVVQQVRWVFQTGDRLQRVEIVVTDWVELR